MHRVFKTAEHAMSMVVKSGTNIYLQGMAATPTFLTNSLTQYGLSNNLKNVTIFHNHTEGLCPYVIPAARHTFRSKSFFVGANLRQAIANGDADYVPVVFQDLPRLLRSGTIPIDVVLCQASYPDKNGMISLGTSVEAVLAAVQNAKYVICQLNRYMPRTLGDSLIHINNVNAVVYNDQPLYTTTTNPLSDTDKRIGKLITNNLIGDGTTVQVGIGGVPNSVLSSLVDHKHIGIHSEVFSDGVIPLVKTGVIDNSRKIVNPGKMVASFLLGTQELFDFVDNNPQVLMKDLQYTNNPDIISSHYKMTSINSCIEVDVTGQVCADSIGSRIYSGFGGQLDFVRGASLSEGGKTIFALHSRTGKGVPKIVPFLRQGSGVVTTRAHVDYVVTEYGIASLRAKSLRERTKSMISIAHPEDRDMLSSFAKKQNLI